MSVFLDAAYRILKDANRPMTPEEITRLALDGGFLTTRGATPAATMSAELYMNIKKKGTASRFKQVGPNLFALNDGQGPEAEPSIKPKIVPLKIKKKVKSSRTSSAHEMLDQELHAIRAYLNGTSEKPPMSEKICDWITLCYTLGLYSEGQELFNSVVSDEVNEWYYERTKKMARLCMLHLSDK